VSRALLRGLAVLESLGDEPVGVRELARRLQLDKGALSRTLAALAVDGWVTRDVRGYRLGPRARALGASRAHRETADRATEMAALLSGLTRLNAYVQQLAGSGMLLLAAATGAHVPGMRGWRQPTEVWATAGGIALLAQLPQAGVDVHVAQDPWPCLGPGSPSRPAVLAEIARSRAGETAIERRWTSLDTACLARPWPALDPDVPTSLAVGGVVDEIERRRPQLDRLLRVATAAGATRTDLLAAAAEAPADPSPAPTRSTA